MPGVHEYRVADTSGNQVSIAQYAGKLLLVVNVASKCGLTPQYAGLEALYRTNRERGLEILAFPCNQFLGQEPGTDEEIQTFCRIAYDVSFPVFAKIDVNGPEAAPLYRYLRAAAPTGDDSPETAQFLRRVEAVRPPGEPDDVRWNFTKFLVGRTGTVIKRYDPSVLPDEIGTDLERYFEA